MTSVPDPGRIEDRSPAAPPPEREPGVDGPQNESTAQLIATATEQLGQLVRQELELARAELTQSAKRAGTGAGLFGGAGLVALYGVGVLIATAIIALGLVLPLWLAALLVGLVLLAVAGVMALVGKKQVTQVTPPAERTVENVKADIDTVTGGQAR